MGLVIVENVLKKEDLELAREDYEFYIKITADLAREIVVMGGEYHADAEKILIEEYQSQQRDIWGGGFNLRSKEFETNALINLRPGVNESLEILNSKLRERFLGVVKRKLQGIGKLT